MSADDFDYGKRRGIEFGGGGARCVFEDGFAIEVEGF